MSWTDLLSYLGLRKPYDFNRAIAFILCCIGLLGTAALAIALSIKGMLYSGTLRSSFLFYLFLLFSISVLLLRFRVLSGTLLCLGFIELSLVLVTQVGRELGLPLDPLMPVNQIIASSHNRFEYHPLLMAVPRENFVSKTGVAIRHNSKGLRGNEIEIDSNQKLINAYGGSTTYDLGVPNGSTWTEKLEIYLGKDWVIANLGVPGYSAVEHIVQTAFYPDKAGILPTCSLYYVGWNDIRNAHLPRLDSAYADFHLLSQLTNLQLRSENSPGDFSPLYRAVRSILRKQFDTVPYPPDYRTFGPAEGSDEKLERIFLRHVRTLHTLNTARGVKTVFIGQVLNPARLTSESVYGWLPRVKDKDVWPLQERFNLILKREAERLGAGAIVLDVKQFGDSDFVDNGHFSVSGSDKFARFITADVKRFCSRESPTHK